MSKPKVDRIKKKFVQEGLDLTLSSQPSQCEYDLKVDGRLKAQLLALSCSAPPERHDCEYERYGVCNVFMASEPLAGRRLSKVTERRTKRDLAVFLQDIAASHLDVKRITLVMDNLNTAGSLYEAFTLEQAKALWDRFAFVYNPKHGRWLNMAEIEINAMVSQCLE